MAMIDGGGAAHRALCAPAQPLAAFEPLPLEALAGINLEAYAVLVVPRSCDAEALLARRHQIRRFLDRGGVLIAFGELWTDWLPGARWEPEAGVDILQAPRLLDHPLLRGVTPDEIWWHRGQEHWCCHGHLLPPHGAEALVLNADGDAWCYVDRVSTRGTILAASNLDLDTHTFHGNPIARMLLERVVVWAEQEAEHLESRRDDAPGPIAGYFSGVHFQRGFFAGEHGAPFAIVPAAELGALDLRAYTALWVPRESDQRTLEAQREKIAAYLHAGGLVVCFEEIDRPWLPGAAWESGAVDLSTARRTDSPLARSIGALQRPWHAHGALRVGQEAEILIGAEDGRALLATYPVGAGTVLAGTVDPDAHAGFGSDLPAAFLDEILAWVRQRAARREMARAS